MRSLYAVGRIFIPRSPKILFTRASHMLNQKAEPIDEISSVLRQYLDKSSEFFSEEYTRLSTIVSSVDRPSGFRNSLEKWTSLKLLMNLNERLLDLRALDADSTKLLEELDDGSDTALQDLVSQEQSARRSEAKSIETQILSLLLPPDPYANCSAVRLQLIAGAGGQEAGLFARDLFCAYAAFVRQRGWLISPSSSAVQPGEDSAGPIHSLEVRVSAPPEGDGEVFRLLRWEAGVHRVQRVPVTSKLNKIHTSTVAVTILPEVGEAEVEISPDDLEWEVFRSSGAGGQHVNKTESAVRLRHRPSGHVVACQAERSQLANRQTALRLLKAKLVEEATQQKVESDMAKRRAQMGSLERSDRIRTYNYQQDRITDHRLGRSWSGLASYMHQGTPVLEEAAQALEEAFTLNALKTLEKPHFLI